MDGTTKRHSLGTDNFQLAKQRLDIWVYSLIRRISCAADSAGATPSRPSAPSAEIAKVAPGNGTEKAYVRPEGPPADANGGTPDRSTARKNPSNPALADGTDDADANIREQSGGWRARI